MKKYIFLSCLLSLAILSDAQTDDFKQFMQRQRAEYRQFAKDRQAEWDEFRQMRNAEYAEFVRSRWEPIETFEADTVIKEKEVVPVVYQEEADSVAEGGVFTVGNNPIPVTNTIQFIPQAQSTPKPISPVQAKDDGNNKQVLLSYYGAPIRAKFPLQDSLHITNLNEENISECWKMVSDKKYDITLKSVLDARTQQKLGDWAYMDMLRMLTEKRYGKSNEAVLMQAYLMSQSGYKVRMAMSENKLYMLIASQYDIYGMRYVKLDGQKFFIIGSSGNEKIKVCSAKFDKEQSLSLQLKQLPSLSTELTPIRSLTSKKGVTVKVSSNQNMIDFFGNYPKACLNGDYTTRWAVYANTPADPILKETLYPQLQKIISTMQEKDAVSILLNWVQTAFPYKYDDEVWGGDRAFFPQETLYYPYCDCEDRAILFSRIIRDVMHLDVVLLYYPGHMATAVGFKSDCQGDYLTYNNQKYIVCDPTYINAPVGKTMSGMDNQQAQIIALK